MPKGEDYWVFNIDDFVSYVQDKNFLAYSYTKYRNKIGLNIDGKFLNERKEVALVWPFKDCVLEGGMTKEDEKRKEIFFNEILAQDEVDKLLAPKVLTNWKRYGVASVGTGHCPVPTVPADTKALLNIWKDMKTKSFLNYNVDIKKFDETIDEFGKLSLAKQKRILFDFLNKNQLYVGLSEIEDKEFGVGEGDKKLNEEFYG